MTWSPAKSHGEWPDAAAPGGARAVARCDLLGIAPFSDHLDGLYRGYLTPAFFAARDAVAGWMAEAGMTVRCDAAANLIGRYEGTREGARALMIGSHLDSVRDGGRYDGPLGIMLGIELVDELNRCGIRLPFAIEVIAFGDEEGSRFSATMLTSRAVAGRLGNIDLAQVIDGEGVTLSQAGVEIARFRTAAREPCDVLGYFEVHIEQGPSLEAEGLAVGTVTAIAAQRRLMVDVAGRAGHAGTTPMALRQDALCGAAEMVLAIERMAMDDASDLVATVGRMEIVPGGTNVIPGRVRFSVDIRAGDAARRDRAVAIITAKMHEVAARRTLKLAVDDVHELAASLCDAEMMDLLDEATIAAGQTIRRLVSGAGHDAMVMAAFCPTVMLFIRCRGGVSHHPSEHVEAGDAAVALRVMRGFVERLGTVHGG